MFSGEIIISLCPWKLPWEKEISLEVSWPVFIGQEREPHWVPMKITKTTTGFQKSIKFTQAKPYILQSDAEW